MTEDSIEFQALPQGKDAGGAVRQSFRVPVSDKENILAILGPKTFCVADISVTGIAVHADSCLEFESGQIIDQAELWLGTQRLTGLTGRVIHCSVHASGSLQFGIVWLDMDGSNLECLKAVLSRMKARVLDCPALPDEPAKGRD